LLVEAFEDRFPVLKGCDSIGKANMASSVAVEELPRIENAPTEDCKHWMWQLVNVELLSRAQRIGTLLNLPVVFACHWRSSKAAPHWHAWHGA